MNCSKCGSPLDLRPFADRVRCAYCGSTELVGAEARGSDRILWTEELQEADCPRCECPLVRVTIDGNPAAACPECHGVLCSNAVFGAVVQQRRASFQGAEPPPQPVDRAQLHEVANCPACERVMETHIYAGPGCQVIDTCGACHLVWIDCGELTVIECAPGRRK
ncbi:MAG TPA: hypothetical protein VFG20_12370 [Planctomycetaceae bacterium]|nr:hypothetical protein [Planctomycetaceae bacterium]